MYKLTLFTLLFSFFADISVYSQSPVDNAPVPVYPVPSEEQIKWHEMEMNAFVHFTTNTFTGREWGMGNENPAIFNPTSLNARQWTGALKDAGFQGLILTAKHHDGFCLWPSKFTKHSVASSSYKNGKGDIVKEVSDACRMDNLQFGIYLSPWDRNHAEYGKKEYIEYYRNQLQELFSNYGNIFEMWFDGANGGDGYYGGANETRKINGRTYYDWPNTIALVQKIQPQVIFFSDAGPGVRWVGNEKGIAGPTNWNMISTDTLFAGKAGIEGLLNTGAEDGKQWVPAEVDVSIRPGWFYHEEENNKVKSGDELFEIYLTSVGRGSTLLLNIPPDKRGLFHPNDLKSLKDFRVKLDQEFKKNLAANAKAMSYHTRQGGNKFTPSNLTDNNTKTYWATDDGTIESNFIIDLGKPATVKYIVLQEYIRLGQRVKAFSIEAWINGIWQKVGEGTTIGYKRIIRIPEVVTTKLRINILDARAGVVMSEVKVF
jgi:alpha-L-fucosidase